MDETKPSFAIKPLRLPEKAIDLGLSSSELLILARIVMFTKDGTQSAFYSNTQAMNEWNFGLRTVMRAFRTLEDKGIITVEFVKVNGVNQRQVSLNLAHPVFSKNEDNETDVANLAIAKKTMVKMAIEGSQNGYEGVAKMTTGGSQNGYPTIRNIYKENNNEYKKEYIAHENEKPQNDQNDQNETQKAEAEIVTQENQQTLEKVFDVAPVPVKPKRGAISDTTRDLRKCSAELVIDNPPTYEETLELVKNVINTHIQERIKENKSYEYTQGIDASNEAHSCLDYYEANGFTRKQGNKQVPLTSWKLAVSGWVRRHLSQLLERYSRGEHLYARPKPQQTIQGLSHESTAQADRIKALFNKAPSAISNNSKLIMNKGENHDI